MSELKAGADFVHERGTIDAQLDKKVKDGVDLLDVFGDAVV